MRWQSSIGGTAFVLAAVITARATPNPQAVADAGDPSPQTSKEHAVYRGSGLCQFVLKDYELPPRTEASINQVVQRLLQQHRTIFGFQTRPDFRLHMRIFGRFDDYERYTVAHRVRVPGIRNSGGLTNLAGYYSGYTKELVTWRQNVSSNFANVLLHEASHAIMDAHFDFAPIWLLEGCAEYFAYPKDMQDARDVRSLRTRWGLLNVWLQDHKLTPLTTFVNLRQRDWDKLDIERAYITSWSVFQFLASTEPNRTLTRKLITATGSSWRSAAEENCAAELEASYPGGLKKLEADWHGWIVKTGRQLFPERYMEQLRELDRERSRQVAP